MLVATGVENASVKSRAQPCVPGPRQDDVNATPLGNADVGAVDPLGGEGTVVDDETENSGKSASLEPLRTITAILPGSKWSCLLLSVVLQDALSEVTEIYPPLKLRVFVDVHFRRSRGGACLSLSKI